MYQTLSLLLWPALYMTYSYINLSDNPKTQTKLVTNLISSTNCYSSVILGSMFYLTGNPSFYQTSFLVNSCYFVWDTYRIILMDSKAEYMYILHHAVGLLLFNSMNYYNSDYKYVAYYLAEVSNIFNFVIYHYLKTRDTNNKKQLNTLNTLSLLQIIWYGFFRIPVAMYILLYKRRHFSNLLYYPTWLIFIMGFSWWTGQLKSYRKNKIKYLKLE